MLPAASPDIAVKARKMLATRPDLRERVVAIANEMRAEFGGAEPYFDSSAYEPGDPPITIMVYPVVPENEYWDRYDRFVHFLNDHDWLLRSDLGVYVGYTGPEVDL